MPAKNYHLEFHYKIIVRHDQKEKMKTGKLTKSYFENCCNNIWNESAVVTVFYSTFEFLLLKWCFMHFSCRPVIEINVLYNCVLLCIMFPITMWLYNAFILEVTETSLCWHFLFTRCRNMRLINQVLLNIELNKVIFSLILNLL